MGYRLAVEDTVRVPVRFTLNSGGKMVSCAFSLTCERLTQTEIDQSVEEMKAGGDTAENPFEKLLTRVIRGWSDQRVVLDDDGKPAEFCAESLAVLFGIAGFSFVAYKAYGLECGAKTKN